MKKLLLTLALAGGISGLASATDYTIFPCPGNTQWTAYADEKQQTTSIEVNDETFKLTLDQDQNTSNKPVAPTDLIKVYKGSTFKIETGVDMKQVVFTISTASSNKYVVEGTPGTGWTGSLNTNTAIYTFTNTSGSGEFSFNANNAQVRIEKIVVSDEIGSTPEPPTPTPTDGYTSALGADFTFEQISGEINPWSHDAKYGLKGSAFTNSTVNACAAIAASPVLNLEAGKTSELTFENVFNQYKVNNVLISAADFKGYAYIMVKEGEGEWTVLKEMEAPAEFGWNYYNYGPVDLSAYAGKAIRIGFKYVSTEECAGTWEIKTINVTNASTTGDTPEPPVTDYPTSSKEAPLTVAQMIAAGVPANAVANVWVKGYIVGFIPDKSINEAVFTLPEDVENISAANLLIADSKSETTVANCVPVQLPSGKIRTALNLKDNPGNLGKELNICGSAEKYFGVPGLKSPTDYVLEGNDTPEPPTEAKEVNSVKETIACDSKTLVKVNYPLTVAFVPKDAEGKNWKNIFAVDEAGEAIQIYGENSYNNNDVIPAGWNATYEFYNDVTPELVPADALPAADGQKVYTPAEITDGNVTIADVNRVVVIKNVTFAAATPSDKNNFEGESAGKTLSFRNNYTIAGVEAGTYDVKVVVTVYQNAPSLYVIEYTSTTGVSEITDADNAPAKYFDLNGRQVKGNLDKGIYVRVQNGKATKVLVK